MKVLLAVITLTLVACTQSAPPAATAPACAPFRDLAWEHMSPDDRATLSDASDDFCAVLAGNRPPHAQQSLDFKPPPNSGTRLYLGQRYQLTALRSYRFAGGVPVAVAGPVLRLDAGIASPEPIEVSQVRLIGMPPVR